jgi:ADP-ribose pyrophosphatase YjhB (NUDIX family)
VFSAGGVVWRAGASGPEVLLCRRHDSDLWALPKGTPEPGESLAQAALREVREETGVEVEAEAQLGEIRYWFSRPEAGVRYFKTVKHYLMRPISGDPSLHDQEFDEVAWVPADRAVGLLTYPNESRVLRKALEAIQAREEGGTS